MKKKYILFITIILFSSSGIISCKRQDDFLNIKRNLGDVTPSTLTDYQAIMDSTNPMNQAYSAFGFVGSDNFYLTDATLSAQNIATRAAYLWQADIYQGQGANYGIDWSNMYLVIEYTNVVLDGLEKISPGPGDQTAYNNVKGAALFYRALCFYDLAQMYCNQYDPAHASTDLGIVLRKTSDVNVRSTRATVQETYDQILNDLKIAVTLLPTNPLYQTKPSQISANALLAKTYLVMGDYTNSLAYSKNYLTQLNTLLDYNTLSSSNAYPFPTFQKNTEVSFWALEGGLATSLTVGGQNKAIVDQTLYSSYDGNDLRRSLFYLNNSGNIFFRGDYTGTAFQCFNGIATNEIYLISAECNARLGNISAAQQDINTLLIKRYKTGTYVPLTITDQLQLLTRILLERRKELPFTGQIRWEDLRRLNKDPRFALTLTRVSNGVTYTLPPNDPRYTLPIPNNEIELSGIPQNQR